MDFLKQRNRLLAEKVMKNMQSRFMEAYFCETAEEAKDKALELIDYGATVSWGGTMTMKEIGLDKALKEGNYKLLDRENAKEGQDVAREAFFADYFIMSANAICDDGQLINIDGNGNRCAALVFGPKNVIVIAGMNKVVSGFDNAMNRARTIAAPLNIQRFDGKVTGCSKTGTCTDCKSPDSICCNTVITRLSRPAGKIKVILVNEDLGF
jgi:L-lactate utilization protein LutB